MPIRIAQPLVVAAVLLIAYPVAAADIATISQMGTGLAVAVLLDATVIRLILLPAVMRALGPWSWWLPSWLTRLLPDRERAAAEATPELRAEPPGAAPPRTEPRPAGRERRPAPAAANAAPRRRGSRSARRLSGVGRR